MKYRTDEKGNKRCRHRSVSTRCCTCNSVKSFTWCKWNLLWSEIYIRIYTWYCCKNAVFNLGQWRDDISRENTYQNTATELYKWKVIWNSYSCFEAFNTTTSRVFGWRSFQSRMVQRKNFTYTHCNWLSWLWILPDGTVLCYWWSDVEHSLVWEWEWCVFWILNMVTRRHCFLRCSSAGHSSCFRICVMNPCSLL